jgi:hypothetical protein
VGNDTREIVESRAISLSSRPCFGDKFPALDSTSHGMTFPIGIASPQETRLISGIRRGYDRLLLVCNEMIPVDEKRSRSNVRWES